MKPVRRSAPRLAFLFAERPHELAGCARCRARSSSIDVAYESRRKPGASNASPGVTATRASSSSACASSAVVRMPSGDRKSRDVGEQVERAGRLARAGAAAPPPATRTADRAGTRYSSSISVTQSCGPLSAAVDRLLRDRADVRGRVALQRVAGADRAPPARAPSRSASRSSRRPSTPSRRAPCDRACARQHAAAGCAATGS